MPNVFESARAPVVHGNRAAAKRLSRDQVEPSRAREPALVQGRAVAGVVPLSFCTPERRSAAMRWLLVHGKSFRVADTMRWVKKACVSSSAIPSRWSTQPSSVTLI